MNLRKQIIITGIVQAVGFRPFVYNLAKKLNLKGFVSNYGSGVLIEAQGNKESMEIFLLLIKKNAPATAQIDKLKVKSLSLKKEISFTIKSSKKTSVQTSIPADIAVCKNCQKDISDKKNRRYQYPFTNCTDCGPRFTIIKKLPYDRAKTTMSHFKMCPACKSEFETPQDRRFHAQPNCCPVCGPKVSFIYKGKQAGGLKEAAQKIKQGKIIAIKSIGGFHLACSALNKKAVALLRKRKNRPHKPLALMFGDIKTIKQFCYLNQAEEALLKSPQAPAVMLKKRRHLPLISDGLETAAVMLPYTPLHKIIFDILGPSPLVMTSGNISGQPICVTNEEALKKLSPIADGFLLHNRDIHNRMDDSVLFELNGKTHFLRRARGYTPGYITLPSKINKPALALGGNLTNSFCLAKDDKLYLSQYIGDLDNSENIKYFKEALTQTSRLLNIKPQVFIRDAHPDYFAASYKPKAKKIQHHLAHALSVAAEHGIKEKHLAVTFDGTGLGMDNTIWGGEFFVIKNNTWQRAGSLKPVKIAGGEGASTDIWKCAVSYMLASETDIKTIKKTLKNIPSKDIDTAVKMYKNNINCYTYSGAGRLFDAAASILNICHKTTYSAQGAMELEAKAIKNTSKTYPFSLDIKNGFISTDSSPVIAGLIKDSKNPELAATKFHATLAAMIEAVCIQKNIKIITLSGGVFQNKKLLNMCFKRLLDKGFKVFTNNLIPTGDGGLAIGQLYAGYKSFV